MGALSRLKSYFLSWMFQKWQTYPAFAENFANEVMSVCPGLTVGPTVPFGVGTFVPAGVGEVDGEIWLSNDLIPAGAWIWQAGSWNVLAGTGSASPITHIFYKYNEDVADPGLYRVITGSPFPTNITWWTDNTLTTKVQEQIITYDGNNNVIQEQWKYYVSGVLIRTTTDTITNSGPFEVNRTRVNV